MRTIFIVLALVSFTQAIPISKLVVDEFQIFKLEYSKQYKDETEEHFRLKIFNDNLQMILNHNLQYAAGEVSYKLELNEFADMLRTEFNEAMNLFDYEHTLHQALTESSDNLTVTTFISPALVTLPTTVDWSTSGAVTAVKNQKSCGSCWAFSATGALEGQHFRKTRVLVSLSEQNLIDCSQKWGNHGCSGGNMIKSFRYVKDNGGIDTEKSYPYKAYEGSCNFNRNTIGATSSGYVQIPAGNEGKLKEAVATVGPISVAIDAGQNSFHFYKNGIYNEPRCNTRKLSHAVLVVGYGTSAAGQDYWLVKNSWGTSWGDKGYIKMSRNKNNQCGIATFATYPLV